MINTTIAHCKVTAKLGQGGMGEVYRATDTKLDREMDINVTHNRIEHPERWNIRQVLECGNEAHAVTAFRLQPALSDNSGPMQRADAKAVIRCARLIIARKYQY